jgi:hypothetical protein
MWVTVEPQNLSRFQKADIAEEAGLISVVDVSVHTVNRQRSMIPDLVESPTDSIARHDPDRFDDDIPIKGNQESLARIDLIKPSSADPQPPKIRPEDTVFLGGGNRQTQIQFPYRMFKLPGNVQPLGRLIQTPL